jgi:predicted PurR-regulated permease PerM
MVAGILYFFLPPLLSDLSDFLSTLPEYLNIFQAPITGSPLLPLIGGEFSNGFTLQETITVVQDLLKSASQGIFTTVSTVFGGVFSFILIVVFSFYFAMQETSVGDFLRVITPLRHQAYVINLWKRSQHKIGLWMQGQLLLALVVGVLVYLGLAILNVKYALILAFIAAILELIPVFGPVLAAIPAILVAFAAGGTTPALLVTGLYVIIQQFENHLIYPLVVTKVVGVPPLLVILALIIGANLAGFLGMILSVPAAAVAQEIVADIQKRRTQAAGTSSA